MRRFRFLTLSVCACALLLVPLVTTAATITVTAGGDLQQALNAAQPGDTILLQAGAVFTGNFVLPTKGGSSYITIRSSASDSSLPASGSRMTPAYASLLPNIRSDQNGPALRTASGATYWRLQFLEILPSVSNSASNLVEFGAVGPTQTSLSSVPQHLIVDRCYLHGNATWGQRRGLALNSGDTQVLDSYFADFKQVNSDTQAIAGWNGPGPYLIQDNYLEAAGENIMFGGDDPTIPNLVPSNITIRGNLISRPLSWMSQSWTVKNLLELKNAQSVVIEGNTIENHWAAGQQGYAIMLTPRDQQGTAPWTVVKNVTIKNNIIRHVAAVADISGYDDMATSQQTENIVFQNNLMYDVSTAYAASGQTAPGSFGVIGGGPKDLTFDHNTIDNDGQKTFWLYAGYAPTGAKITGLVLTNNLLRDNKYGLDGDNASDGNLTLSMYSTGADVRANTFAGGSASVYPGGNYFPTLTQWLADFVNVGAADYDLTSSSLSKGAATDGTDIGVNFSTLNAALTSTGSAGGSGSGTGGTGGSGSGGSTGGSGSTTGTLPSGWADADIGAVGVRGSASETGGTLTVTASGSDIWGTADAFHFVYESFTGDGTIVARVNSVTWANAWSKAGVMFRSTLDAGSAQAIMLASAGKGTAFQRRLSAGATSVSTAGSSAAPPRWVRLERHGNTFSASESADGSNWTLVGTDTISMPQTVYVGVAVTSHDNASTTAAVVDSIGVSATTATSALPSPWADGDIGSVGIKGSAKASGSTFTVTASGADIWGTADAFHFVYRPWTGDGSIVARVAGVTAASSWSKAGVMFRASLAANAAHAFMLVSAGKGAAFQRRDATGGDSVSTAGSTAAPPRWVRMDRSGNTFTAYESADGSSWSLVGSDTISMPQTIYVGLAVTSHTDAAATTATVDSVSVGSGSSSQQWLDRDIGSVGIAGSAGYSSGTFTVKASGADVWGTADAFHFVYMAWTGDGSVIARVSGVTAVDAWSKAGVMFRAGLGADAAHAYMLVSAGKGAAFQRREGTGWASVSTAGSASAPPRWVRIDRSGDTFTAYESADGSSWTRVGSDTISMPQTLYVGMAVTSHDNSALTTGAIDHVSVTGS